MKTLKTLVVVASFGFLLTNANAQSFITNGLVAYYPFNGNANDASGNGHNGTIVGATFGTNRFNQANSGLLFNGFNTNYVSTSFTPPSGTSSRTFSIWFNTSSTAQDQNSYSTSDGSMFSYGAVDTYAGDRIEMGIQSDGNVYLGSSFSGTTTTTTWNDGKWHHFVVIMPTSATLTTLQIFIDGSLQPVFYYLSATFNTATTYPLVIGKSVGGNYSYNGVMSNLRIYNRALSTNEVTQLYQIESAPIISVQKAVYLTSSNLWTGSNYVVQASTDLVNWTNQGTAFTATTNVWHSTNYWDVPNWNQLFFRLQLQ